MDFLANIFIFYLIKLLQIHKKEQLNLILMSQRLLHKHNPSKYSMLLVARYSIYRLQLIYLRRRLLAPINK